MVEMSAVVYPKLMVKLYLLLQNMDSDSDSSTDTYTYKDWKRYKENTCTCGTSDDSLIGDVIRQLHAKKKSHKMLGTPSTM